MTRRDEALEYHRKGRPGKIAVVPTKPLTNQRDLALAYSPGVAEPCLEIKRDPDDAYEYTAQGQPRRRRHQRHRRARASATSARSPASRSWKARETSSSSSPTSTSSTSRSAPRTRTTSSGSASSSSPRSAESTSRTSARPTASTSRRRCGRRCKIPVFHDDQHGTAIISGAALLNALEIVGKDIDAGHASSSPAPAPPRSPPPSITCGSACGASTSLMCDRAGVIYDGRAGEMDPYKARFATETRRARSPTRSTGADVFVGLSVAGAVTDEMVATHGRATRSSSRSPIRSRRSCPTRCASVRSDAIVATGRSDYPEPGQQRPRLPVHLPRRARRARDRDQRGDEDGGDARARRAREGGRARERRGALRAAKREVRPRLPDPLPVRSARAALGRARGRVGGGRQRRRRRSSSTSRTTASSSRRDSAARAASCAGIINRAVSDPQARRASRRRGAEDHPRRAHPGRRRHRAPDPARQSRDASSERAEPRNIALDGIEIEDPASVAAGAKRTRRILLGAPPAEGHEPRRGAPALCTTATTSARDGRARRRRRAASPA